MNKKPQEKGQTAALHRLLASFRDKPDLHRFTVFLFTEMKSRCKKDSIPRGIVRVQARF